MTLRTTAKQTITGISFLHVNDVIKFIFLHFTIEPENQLVATNKTYNIFVFEVCIHLGSYIWIIDPEFFAFVVQVLQVGLIVHLEALKWLTWCCNSFGLGREKEGGLCVVFRCLFFSLGNSDDDDVVEDTCLITDAGVFIRMLKLIKFHFIITLFSLPYTQRDKHGFPNCQAK